MNADDQRELNEILWDMACPPAPSLAVPSSQTNLTQLLTEIKTLARLWRNGVAAEINPRTILLWRAKYPAQTIKRAMRAVFSRHAEEPLSAEYMVFYADVMLEVEEELRLVRQYDQR